MGAYDTAWLCESAKVQQMDWSYNDPAGLAWANQQIRALGRQPITTRAMRDRIQTSICISTDDARISHPTAEEAR
jgi:hypothetical protein